MGGAEDAQERHTTGGGATARMLLQHQTGTCDCGLPNPPLD